MIITEDMKKLEKCSTCKSCVHGAWICTKFRMLCVEVPPEKCPKIQEAVKDWKELLYAFENLFGKEKKPQKELDKITGRDMIRHPDHYTFRGTEAIEAVKIMTATSTGVEAYLVGCAVKYLYRYPRKNGDMDLAKAEQCIHMLREYLKGRKTK